jgi:adenine-specific DNA-methyltransferase
LLNSCSPFCKNYLLEYKNILQQRDNGKKIYEKWYAFGRRQALDINDDDRIFISSLAKDICNSVFICKTDLFYSGLHISPKSGISKEYILDIIKTNECKILNNSNIKSNKWFSLSKNSFDIYI